MLDFKCYYFIKEHNDLDRRGEHEPKQDGKAIQNIKADTCRTRALFYCQRFTNLDYDCVADYGVAMARKKKYDELDHILGICDCPITSKTCAWWKIVDKEDPAAEQKKLILKLMKKQGGK